MISSRRSALAFVAVTAFALSMHGISLVAKAQGAGRAASAFTAEAFDAARKANKPILIETYATWCDVCARQAPILGKLREEPKYKDLVTFKVNFDTQKDVMRMFNARMQSTLIAFRGTKEVGRSVGETQPEWIDDLLQKTLVEGAS